ncbi:ABC transporter substrate-binding protein [Vibrio sp. JCM 19236]|nr:ABC transporter substrate-binding protein [Vibrio sp. JCM 19236]
MLKQQLKSADVQSATQAIVEKSDVIYALIDNTVASAIEGMIVTANQAKTPVFGAATSYVERGAIASLALITTRLACRLLTTWRTS